MSANDKALEALAAKLDNHEAFGTLLYTHLKPDSPEWPDDDKLDDQLLSNFDPDREEILAPHSTKSTKRFRTTELSSDEQESGGSRNKRQNIEVWNGEKSRQPLRRNIDVPNYYESSGEDEDDEFC